MNKNTLALMALATFLVGCASNDATMTKQEEQDFKGKPRPAGVLEKIQAKSGKPGTAPTGASAPSGG